LKLTLEVRSLERLLMGCLLANLLLVQFRIVLMVMLSPRCGVDPVRWTVCRLGRFRLVEHLRLIGDRR